MKQFLALLLAILCMPTFASVKGSEYPSMVDSIQVRATAPKPAGDWNKMYLEIHGDGKTYTDSQRSEADDKRSKWKKQTMTIPQFADKTDRALDGVFMIAVANLRRYGYDDDADQISADWKNNWKGTLQTLVQQNPALQNQMATDYTSIRDIGDFQPLSTWLDMVETKIENLLGYQLAFVLRITDIKTMNFGLPVVFNPCKYGSKEFTAHFCGDAHVDPTDPHPYRGVAPVVAYWGSVIVCSVATYGAGYFFICSPIATLVEWGVDQAVAPWLAPKIFSWACGS